MIICCISRISESNILLLFKFAVLINDIILDMECIYTYFGSWKLNRDAEMSEISERTNSRIASFSLMSLGTCIIVSVLQLWHLKGFFQKKKLI